MSRKFWSFLTQDAGWNWLSRMRTVILCEHFPPTTRVCGDVPSHASERRREGIFFVRRLFPFLTLLFFFPIQSPSVNNSGLGSWVLVLVLVFVFVYPKQKKTGLTTANRKKGRKTFSKKQRHFELTSVLL